MALKIIIFVLLLILSLSSICLADSNWGTMIWGQDNWYHLVDTDSDGLSDTEEIQIYGTDPNISDTDGDGLYDGIEVAYWGADWDADPDGDQIINLLDYDSDNDGLNDGVEVNILGTDPRLTDTDEDTISDSIDNCPTIYNSDQTNTDGDNYGNACDECPVDPNKKTPGTTGCGGNPDPPLALNDLFVIPRNISKTFNILSNDNDPDGIIDVTTVTLRSATSARGNVLTVNPDGTVTYTSTLDGRGGPDFFWYTIKDDIGLISNEAAVRINRVRSVENP